eukprot:9473150-Pyramimonas_sp.AAC.1
MLRDRILAPARCSWRKFPDYLSLGLVSPLRRFPSSLPSLSSTLPGARGRLGPRRRARCRGLAGSAPGK